MEDWTTKRLLQVYGDKAPVCMCPPRMGCNHQRGEHEMCGPQRKAHRARTILEERGQFPNEPLLSTALSHAAIGEGRGEFDHLWAKTIGDN